MWNEIGGSVIKYNAPLHTSMALMMDLAVLTSAFNIILLASLLYLYVRTYRKTRAIFTVGLMVFSLLLLTQNLVAVYAYVTMSPLFAEGVLPYLFVTGLSQLGGILVLLKISI